MSGTSGDRHRRGRRLLGSAGSGAGAAAQTLEEVAERRIDAERVTARRDHRIDLIDRQLEPRVDRAEHLGALGLS